MTTDQPAAPAVWRVPGPGLTDGEVRLRRWAKRDLAGVFVACQDPELHRWMNLPSPYGEEDAERFLADAATAGDEEGRARLAVVHPDTDRLLGSVGLGRDGRRTHTAVVGYWLAADARGRGFATRAVRLVARWSFADLGVRRLELLTDVDNVASQRVAERAGFAREGVMRAAVELHGRLVDQVVYSLLPQDVGSA